MARKKKERSRPDEESVFRHTLKEGRIPYHVLEYEDGEFTEEERKELLRMLTGLMVYTGCVIPQSIELRDGTKIPLKKIVWNLLSKDDLSPNEMEGSRYLAEILETRARLNKSAIRKFDLSDEEAEKLYFEACGILRAVMILRGLGTEDEKDFRTREKEVRLDKAKKFIEFIKKIK